MLYGLAKACRARRMAARPKVKHVDIATRMRDYLPKKESVDQSTISRFELGATWPRYPMDAIIRSYGHELDVDPLVLWEEGLDRWRRLRAGENLSALDAAAADREPRDGTKSERARSGRARRQTG